MNDKIGNDKIILIHEQTGSRIEGYVQDASPRGVWVDLAGGVTVYADEGWKVEK